MGALLGDCQSGRHDGILPRWKRFGSNSVKLLAPVHGDAVSAHEPSADPDMGSRVDAGG
jgi:hypothetical protein